MKLSSGSRNRALMLALLWCLSSAAGASLIHDYELNGSLADSISGPDLGSDGGTVNATNYSFDPDQGLTLSGGLNGTIDNYSIQMTFNFAHTDSYRKILDFMDKASDNGFYDNGGSLDFVTNAGDNIGGLGPFMADNADADIVLTRDSISSLVSWYSNGVFQWSITDSAGDAVFSAPNNLVRFFEDDTLSSGTEASAGAVDCIRIYDGALTAGEVALLSGCATGNNVPEPATLALLGIGIAGLRFGMRRQAQVTLRNA